MKLTDLLKDVLKELATQKNSICALEDRIEAISVQIKANNSKISYFQASKGADEIGFMTVKNGYKAKKIAVTPTVLNNKFSVLPGIQETDTNEVRLVGDSITRGLLTSYGLIVDVTPRKGKGSATPALK
jgi:hypothetical protein